MGSPVYNLQKYKGRFSVIRQAVSQLARKWKQEKEMEGWWPHTGHGRQAY